MSELPSALEPLLPELGSAWVWEPDKPHARVVVYVSAIEWNGEEVWIESTDREGRKAWNEFGRWIEASVMFDEILRVGLVAALGVDDV